MRTSEEERTITNLIEHMNKLIDEARGKGYAFTFECGEVHFANADTAILYSDEEDFYVGLEEVSKD